MAVWKNGCEVQYMYGSKPLTTKQIQQAVNNMSYTGLQAAAASYLILCRALGFKPYETMQLVEDTPQNNAFKDM